MNFIASDGGSKTIDHLLRAEDNESIEVRGFGVTGSDLYDMVNGLHAMHVGVRSRRPFAHIIMSPSIEYDEASAAYAWDEFEQEFDLVCAPFVEVRHLKIGAGGRMPHHLHRLYSRVKLDRTVASDRQHAPRIQKIARLAEIAAGEPITPGDFDHAIIKALRVEGRIAEANCIEKAVALLPRPKKLTTRKERAEAKRLGDLPGAEIVARAGDAWLYSTDATTLVEGLAMRGLLIGAGDNSRPMVVTPGGALKRLASLINMASDAPRGQKPRLADVLARLGDYPLRPIEAVRTEMLASRDAPLSRSSDVIGRDYAVGYVAPAPELSLASTETPVEPLPAPVAAMADPAATDQPEEDMSPEQELAVADFVAAMDGVASEAARRQVEKIRNEVLSVPRRRFVRPPSLAAGMPEATRRNIGALFSQARRLPPSEPDNWDNDPRADVFIGVGPGGFRLQYKAILARIDLAAVGHVRWVDRDSDDRAKLYLRSGAELTFLPGLAITNRETADSIEVIIAHAIAEGWPSIEILGGSPQWRRQLAIAAGNAGLPVDNVELQHLGAERPYEPGGEHDIRDGEVDWGDGETVTASRWRQP
jgi:hypothetical protein